MPMSFRKIALPHGRYTHLTTQDEHERTLCGLVRLRGSYFLDDDNAGSGDCGCIPCSDKSEALAARQKAIDDHAEDHVQCVARAREMGVPAAWAHTPETYLSM